MLLTNDSVSPWNLRSELAQTETVFRNNRAKRLPWLIIGRAELRSPVIRVLPDRWKVKVHILLYYSWKPFPFTGSHWPTQIYFAKQIRSRSIIPDGISQSGESGVPLRKCPSKTLVSKGGGVSSVSKIYDFQLPPWNTHPTSIAPSSI